MKLTLAISFFVTLFSVTTQSATLSRSYFQVTFRDFMDYGVCETQACDLETLLAAGQIFEAELRSSGVRTDFTASNFCNCQGQARPLENIVSAKKAQLVRAVARSMAQVIASKNPSRPGLFFGDLLTATKPLYEQFMGTQNFMNLQVRLAAAMRNATSMSSLGSQNYSAILTQAFTVGNLFNHSPKNLGCRDRADYSCITPEETESARRYMGTEFNAFNEVAFHGPSHNPRLAPHVERLKSLIRKLNPARTISFRGTGPDERLINLQVGQTYTEPIFISSSLHSKIAQNFMAGAAQIFFTKNCPLISGAGSLFEGEYEVMCNPGTQFKLIHREYRGGSLYLFLEEI